MISTSIPNANTTMDEQLKSEINKLQEAMRVIAESQYTPVVKEVIKSFQDKNSSLEYKIDVVVGSSLTFISFETKGFAIWSLKLNNLPIYNIDFNNYTDLQKITIAILNN